MGASIAVYGDENLNRRRPARLSRVGPTAQTLAMRRDPVLIAGAGLGGLTAALALIARGFEVAVFEQASVLRELGAGVQLGPNGTRVLIGLGLGPALERVVCPAAGKEIRLWNTGRSWTLFDLGESAVARYGAPYWMAHRGDLHAILLNAVHAVRPDAVRLGAACISATQDSDGVALALASGEEVRGSALIGADGVHSRIRQSLFGAGAARFTGLMAWRGLVPMERLPAHQRRPVGANWVGRGGHVVTYPLRRGGILNFVGVVERDDWRVESWTEQGTRAECAADFAGWHADIHRIIEGIETPFKWALLGREPLPRLAEGRVALLGDAAHPMLPFMAQGANMAIEDGLVIARCLEAYANPADAFRAYDAARRERTARAVRASLDNAARFHNPALAEAEGAAAYVDREWQPVKVAARYDWAYDYDASRAPI
jgi:salicylate hydroxylase